EFHGRETATRPHHANRQRAGPSAAGRNRVALSTSAGHWGGAHATTPRTTEPGDCDCGQSATATVSSLPTLGRTPQACAQDRGRHRARVGWLPLGGAPTGAGEVTA